MLRSITTTTPHLRITALGGLSVTSDGKPVAGAGAQPRRLAVLAVLARAGDRGATRDTLVALLWPDAADEDRARRNLTQALYALRRDLGSEEAIIGLKEIRLNPDIIASDLAEFEAARAEGSLEQAVRLYAGPFLQGFHLPGAPEFEQWVDTERRALSQTYSNLLSTLATRATERGDHAVAIDAWRRLAATEPLDARWATALMMALADAGQVSAALQHARIYEALVAQQLDLPPDRVVVELAERLRAEASRGDVPRTSAVLPSLETTSGPPQPEPSPLTTVRENDDATASEMRPPALRRWLGRPLGKILIVVSAIIAVVLAVSLGSRARSGGRAPGINQPIVAVGRIADYRGTPTGFADAVGDLLATNLARAPGLRVLSAVRMHEIAGRLGSGADSAAALARVARQAGATELVDGTLFALPGGGLRLDLRRVDLASGRILVAQIVNGADVFALVDSGTALLLGAMGARTPLGAVASVTTRSPAAYRLYAEGLRLYARGDLPGAHQLFGQAVHEDSAFAMAAYYHAVSGSDDDIPARVRLLDRALRLSASATDRERLIIRGGWALTSSSPTLAAIGETLATRYPDEVDGHLYVGLGRMYGGDFLGALPYFDRVIARDSQSLRALAERAGDSVGRAVTCGACVALKNSVTAYQYADSIQAAERATRRWLALQPEAALPWRTLAWVLLQQNRIEDAQRARRSSAERLGSDPGAAGFLAETRIWSGDYDGAERLLREQLDIGAESRGRALWLLTIAYRQQGRLNEALAAARQMRRLSPQLASAGVTQDAFGEAQVLFEMGRYRESAALFDSIGQWREAGLAPSWYARNRAWSLAHAAAALAAAGDTSALVPLIDTVRVYGAQSFLGRDQQLHHHVRALLLLARGDDEGAIRELHTATFSPTLGYARTAYLLAAALIRRRRPAEAIPVLQPTLRGSLESSNFYVTRTEFHELLARAWDASRLPAARDSAATHWRAVADAWSQAEPPLRARGLAARAALTAR